MADSRITPLISVISITLNDRDGLARTVASLQSQIDAPDHEHVVVDGMSDYDVAGLLADLGSPARLHQGRDAGLYDAMNTGTSLARGDYLMYLNGGDTLAGPEVLEKVGAVLEQARPDFLWGDSLERQLDGALRYKSSLPLRRLPLGMISHHQTMLFRRALIDDNVLRYDLAYQIAADYDFVLRHVKASKKTHYLPEPICIFQRGGASYENRHAGRREQFRIRRKAYGSTLFAAGVFIAQGVLRSFRGLFPAGYWALRKRLE